jgi:hypothetical protein
MTLEGLGEFVARVLGGGITINTISITMTTLLAEPTLNWKSFMIEIGKLVKTAIGTSVS